MSHPNIDWTNGELVAVDMRSSIKDRVLSMHSDIVDTKPEYDYLADYFNGDQTPPKIPVYATDEIKDLRRRSVLNLIPLLVLIPAQISFVDGFRRSGEMFPEEWNCWERSNMAAKQTVIYQTALKYGQAFTALENLGRGKPEVKLLPTRSTIAYFHDPVNDIHPVYAFTIRSYPLNEKNPGRAVYYDDVQTIHFDYTAEGKFTIAKNGVQPHDLDVCPITRYVCSIDDDGAVRGVIEPAIPMQDRVNQAAFDLLITSSYSSFKVRYAAGLVGEPVLNSDGTPKVDAEGKQIYKPIPVSPARFLSTDNPNTKFGTLDETPLDGFIEALDAAIKQFAVIGQLPPHSLLGNMSNLSAETLVAAMSQTMRFGHMLKTTWGGSHQAQFRLIAKDMGLGSAADDYTSEVRWRDMSDQTMTAVLDALGKAAQMLQVPRRALWAKFPGVTAGELSEWEELYEEQRIEDMVDAMNSPQAARTRETTQAPRTPKAPTPAEVFGGGGVGNNAGA